MTREEAIKKLESLKISLPAAKDEISGIIKLIETPWISSKEDLPCNHEGLIRTQDKVTKKVIVMEKYDGVMVDFMKKAKSGVWYWSRSIKVLYWMPIPEMPKE